MHMVPGQAIPQLQSIWAPSRLLKGQRRPIWKVYWGRHQSVPFSVALVCRERKVGVLYRISVFFLAFTMLGWFKVTSCAAQRSS